MEVAKKMGSGHKGSNNGRGVVGELVIVNNEKSVFGLPDLMKASAEVLGNGVLGSSYKTQMANGVVVVVKRMREMNTLSKSQFNAEIRKLGRLHHPNILTPLAFHYRPDEKLLIYDFVPKGSLLYLLHGMASFYRVFSFTMVNLVFSFSQHSCIFLTLRFFR
jgi:serine/threonine protein kinase